MTVWAVVPDKRAEAAGRYWFTSMPLPTAPAAFRFRGVYVVPKYTRLAPRVIIPAPAASLGGGPKPGPNFGHPWVTIDLIYPVDPLPIEGLNTMEKATLVEALDAAARKALPQYRVHQVRMGIVDFSFSEKDP